ncbi:Hypothetical_protein [Hexamita inflata]|uniref:Hypothetical_protein n=1 Tax=Hexamita inflata TaxID=28002 RepID=A0AA86UCH9_9EUKA|nr:Hypothetical protein HINF_LOCUS40230 [Hexamita inflata]
MWLTLACKSCSFWVFASKLDFIASILSWSVDLQLYKFGKRWMLFTRLDACCCIKLVQVSTLSIDEALLLRIYGNLNLEQTESQLYIIWSENKICVRQQKISVICKYIKYYNFTYQFEFKTNSSKKSNFNGQMYSQCCNQYKCQQQKLMTLKIFNQSQKNQLLKSIVNTSFHKFQQYNSIFYFYFKIFLFKFDVTLYSKRRDSLYLITNNIQQLLQNQIEQTNHVSSDSDQLIWNIKQFRFNQKVRSFIFLIYSTNQLQRTNRIHKHNKFT